VLLATTLKKPEKADTVVCPSKLEEATQRRSIETHLDHDLDVAYVGLLHGRIAGIV